MANQMNIPIASKEFILFQVSCVFNLGTKLILCIHFHVNFPLILYRTVHFAVIVRHIFFGMD